MLMHFMGGPLPETAGCYRPPTGATRPGVHEPYARAVHCRRWEKSDDTLGPAGRNPVVMRLHGIPCMAGRAARRPRTESRHQLPARGFGGAGHLAEPGTRRRVYSHVATAAYRTGARCLYARRHREADRPARAGPAHLP